MVRKLIVVTSQARSLNVWPKKLWQSFDVIKSYFHWVTFCSCAQPYSNNFGSRSRIRRRCFILLPENIKFLNLKKRRQQFWPLPNFHAPSQNFFLMGVETNWSNTECPPAFNRFFGKPRFAPFCKGPDTRQPTLGGFVAIFSGELNLSKVHFCVVVTKVLVKDGY